MLKFRPRYSLQSLLVLVTLVAIGCWLFVRQREFAHRAHFHDEESIIVGFDHLSEFQWTRDPKVQSEYALQGERADAKREYHKLLAEKYHRAEKYPWLPVVADPPLPALSSP